MDRTADWPTVTRADILGVPVDLVDMESALLTVRQMLAGNEASVIAAVNPEKVIAAQKNPELLRVLEQADLIIPDGIGIVMAARLLGKGHVHRVPGSDLMPQICSMAARHGHKVFLYGAKPEVVEKAAELLQERFSGLMITGTQHGYVPENEMNRLVESINASGAEVLFVGLGSPRQELWMQRHRQELNIRICQGVGGTFDAICGHPRRAPMMFQKLYLEWLYRLVSEPKRAHRQLALPRFAAQVLRAATIRDKTDST